MKRLVEAELVVLLRQMERVYAWPGPAQEPAGWAVPARLEFPLGELFNPGLAGYLWAWRMTGRLRILPIGRADRFNAQGLEGKCRVEPVNLTTALLAARELPPFRRAVWITNERRK